MDEPVDHALLRDLQRQISLLARRVGMHVTQAAKTEFIDHFVVGARPNARVEMATLLLAAGAAASRTFGIMRVANPGLDMMLDLYIRHQTSALTSLTSLGLASRTAQSTGLRWVNLLHENGFITRIADPTDARRYLVELTAEGVEKIELFLDRALRNS